MRRHARITRGPRRAYRAVRCAGTSVPVTRASNSWTSANRTKAVMPNFAWVPMKIRRAEAAIDVEEKRRIADAAAALVGPAQTVYIDDGYLPSLVAQRLTSQRPVTVVTSSLPTAVGPADQSGSLHRQQIASQGLLGDAEPGRGGTHVEATLSPNEREEFGPATLHRRRTSGGLGCRGGRVAHVDPPSGSSGAAQPRRCPRACASGGSAGCQVRSHSRLTGPS